MIWILTREHETITENYLVGKFGVGCKNYGCFLVDSLCGLMMGVCVCVCVPAVFYKPNYIILMCMLAFNQINYKSCLFFIKIKPSKPKIFLVGWEQLIFSYQNRKKNSTTSFPHFIQINVIICLKKLNGFLVKWPSDINKFKTYPNRSSFCVLFFRVYLGLPQPNKFFRSLET